MGWRVSRFTRVVSFELSEKCISFLIVPFIGAIALFDKVSEDIQDRGIA